MLNLNKLFYGKGFGENIFLYILYGSWIIYFLSLIGTFSFGIQYLYILREVLKVYVALFLIIQFNPYKKERMMSRFDKQIAFQAGIFLFLTSILGGLVKHYIPFTNKLV